MSASLVGSEMCIRDSSLSGVSTAPRTPPKSASGAWHWRRIFLRGSGGCLLYTSDAAAICSV
eukprot:452818-Alexandrium_andersonii.AAC.1